MWNKRQTLTTEIAEITEKILELKSRRRFLNCRGEGLQKGFAGYYIAQTDRGQFESSKVKVKSVKLRMKKIGRPWI